MLFKLNDTRNEIELSKAAHDLVAVESCFTNSLFLDPATGNMLFVEFECMVIRNNDRSFMRDFRRCTRLVKQFFPNARLMQDFE